MSEERDDDTLELAYERLAAAIDRAGPERERLFLAKLCLVLANQCETVAAFEAAIAAAEREL